jgi:dTDP-4-amino-4,6-dideoxygalactose transaminase
MIRNMASQGIECRRIWKPLHTWSYFTDYPAYDTGVSRRLHQSGICLPSGIDLTSEKLEFVWNKLEEAVYERS